MVKTMLLGSILNNIEITYNLTQYEVDKLDQCYEMAIRNIARITK